ncbi:MULTISPECIES: penicillin-binding protein 1B [Aliivibrio]|uniref:Penicillin-binding protein 1B n=1 Tax=Aliivibrio finisterrensis TaxID=511998 RepID=A0A4Q5KY36_9GAMM|nr:MULTISPECIES: penicillin-binding protein 1B [Aliivibrio]MDD9178164.1 penicillin-binding protein 1B [Aliivibrio sp. A6]RYU52716.1 penicillin-binding protein 1B [Aliivibrio finisterrensis]RYU55756.1 penicillin-binding protein 1B [Aliivibrio finisterrensis]RYU60595.1 penicillin-binding protein 1B [Aliivibrio finisterrensis]RYU66243.1 penicillin-binding protein 1B [Aliivibrio finisterrensis]
MAEKKKAPAKTAPKKTVTKKKTPAKRKSASKKKAKSPRSFWKGLMILGFKLSLVVLAILVIAGIYLDTVVKNRFDGQLFTLPTVVYSRVLTLAPGQNISLETVKKELDLLKYQKVRQPQRSGEYSSSSTKIELIRRPFEFQQGPEPDRHVMLYFNSDGLQKIENRTAKKQMGFLQIEPQFLGMLDADDDQQRLFLRREQFPEVMVDALLATEDRDFYQHDGVSPLAIARAMVVNAKAGRTVQGGSTLTQQLAKNLFLSRERTLWRKVREAYIALILDYRYSKDRILEAYLNEVYLGQTGGEAIHGFGLAAQVYFGRPIEELRIDQLAMLVGMVKGPSYYNPMRFPERVKERRDLVLRLMMQEEILSPRQYEMAASRPLDVKKRASISTRQPAYFQQLKWELKEKAGEAYQRGEGLRVFTTLDPLSQQKAEKAVERIVPQLEKRAGKGLESAMVIVDRQSGEIRAMIGGSRTGFDGFNRAINAKRPIGSLVKPAIYLSALESPEKYSLATTLDDKPISLKGSKGTTWTPRNYDRKFRGQVPLYYALSRSLNVPTVNLGLMVGLNKVTDTLVKLGVNAQEINQVPSMLLGSISLSPYQVAQMYQTLGNGGRKAPLTALKAVVNTDGVLLYENFPRSSRVVPEQATWLTIYGMKKTVSEGTARFLNSKYSWAALAGKTGTSNDSRDSWYAGIDGREVAITWLGRDDNKPMKLTGSSGALRVYADYLSMRPPEAFNLPWPNEVTTAHFDLQENKTLKPDCSGKENIPIWDIKGQYKAECERRNTPAAWLTDIFGF